MMERIQRQFLVRLTLLDLNLSVNQEVKFVVFLLSSDDPSLSVGELFLCGIGGTQLRRHLAHVLKEMQEQDPQLLWSTYFNQAVYTLLDLLYPLHFVMNISLICLVN